MLFNSVENKLQILISLNSCSYNSPFLMLQPLSVTKDYVLHKYLQLINMWKAQEEVGYCYSRSFRLPKK